MELSKNIFFNTDKLIENTQIKLYYTGEFFQNASEEVFIHYGFGSEWSDVQDIQMLKTELGFQTEITLKDAETFNFCFRNENNEWDNNNTENYIFPIEKTPVELTIVENASNALSTTRKLRKSYIWSKKIRLAVYKIISYLPKIVSGNYKKKVIEQ